MVWTELQDQRCKRLAVAMLLVQIAIVEWLISVLFWQVVEWLYTQFQFDPYRLHVTEFLYLTGIARWVVLLIAAWIITRGLRGLWTVAGGWLIFNVLLVTVIRDFLGCVNWLWSMGNGEKLVVADPLQPHFAFLTTWVWFVLWLLMINAGVAIASEVNSRYERRLIKSRRIRTLLIIGLIAWGAKAMHTMYGVEILSWFMTQMAGDMDINAIVNTTTGYGLAVHFAPTAVFCALFFATLKRARRALRSPYPPPCPDCGQVLVTGTANHCTECDWQPTMPTIG